MIETANLFGMAIIDGLIAALTTIVGLLPEAIAAPFSYHFMQRGLLTAVLGLYLSVVLDVASSGARAGGVASVPPVD
ncbi:hypothetical protein [Billgrantia endophytica]|uniref:Uncharacterized protein n=1 Tax=Billgrantia endophytica TaxID=2033802 RepID=A0A2N7U0E1_9GAMM|nr:hypothetical protein [Halomonas endophytica]PMR73900.1 hypothetical protein C1H69_16390 [Halomonas endophytica]